MRDVLARLLQRAAAIVRPDVVALQRMLDAERRQGADARQSLANLQRAHGLLLAAFNATSQTLRLAMGVDHDLTRRAVERAKVALAAQNPAMHLDINAVVTRMGVPPADEQRAA